MRCVCAVNINFKYAHPSAFSCTGLTAHCLLNLCHCNCWCAVNPIREPSCFEQEHHCVCLALFFPKALCFTVLLQEKVVLAQLR